MIYRSNNSWIAGMIITIIIAIPFSNLYTQKVTNPSRVTIARLKYFGGGDWYWGNSSLPNLIEFIKQNTRIPISDDEVRVTLSDERLYNYPFLYLTGHGSIKFSDDEALRLNRYLTTGGFLLANDSYGLRESFFAAMRKVFPDVDPVELPFNHGVFNCYYNFPNGLPKIH